VLVLFGAKLTTKVREAIYLKFVENESMFCIVTALQFTDLPTVFDK